MQIWAAIVKIITEILKKIRIQLPVIFLPDITKGDEIATSSGYLHSHVHLVFFTIANIWKQPNCPSVEK
jgi:hypothetical protein